jgi:two-component system response regulator MprA
MGGAGPQDDDQEGGTTEELGGLVVLVVDDEAVVRAYVARALAVAGMDVAVAADGREALRLVADDRVRPAVVVTDIEMQSMTGVELAARLLAMRPSIRIVMMTADPERAEAARRHPAIVDQVILKPMRLEAIVDAVRAAAMADLDPSGGGRASGALGVRSSVAEREKRLPRPDPTASTPRGTDDR